MPQFNSQLVRVSVATLIDPQVNGKALQILVSRCLSSLLEFYSSLVSPSLTRSQA